MSLNFILANSAVVNCGSASTLADKQPFTLSAWINPNSTGAQLKGRFFCKETTGTELAAGGWRFNTATTNIIEFVKAGPGSNIQRQAAINSITTGSWQHVVCTWDGTTLGTGIRMYVNSTEVAYGTSFNDNVVTDSSNSIYIGNRGDKSREFDGLISEASFFNRVLTQSEINLLALSKVKGIPLQILNVIGYWPLDDFANGMSIAATSGSIIDRTVNANNGIGLNTPVASAEQILSYQG